jgi:type I restriction enzyme, S subunit
MESEWPKVKLGPNCSKIGSGATPRGGSKVYLDQGEIALIRSQNVYNEGFTKDGLTFITTKHAKQLANVSVEENDILLNITGDSVARCCLVDADVLPACVNQHVAIIRPFPNVFNSRFLRYFLISPKQQSFMLAMSHAGATRKALTKGMIESFSVPKPNLRTQRAIAHILGTLDDKIELNRRMNETLESIARAIFKSWFVDFDPVHAKAEGRNPGLSPEIAALFPDSFQESELGRIPKGWKDRNLNEIASVIDCLHSKKPEKKDDDYLLIQVFNVGDTGRLDFSNPYFISPEEYKVWIKRMEVQPGDLVITKTGRVGAVGQMPHGYKAAMGRNMVGIRAVLGITTPYFLKDLLLSDYVRSEINRNMNDGTILQSLHVKAINKLRTVLPLYNVIQAYSNLIRPIHQNLERNDEESRNLASLRETLLPKLISGELRVSDAETLVEEAGL